MFRKTLVAVGAAAALTFIPTTAYALHCENVSRDVNPNGATEVFLEDFGFSVLVKGNWVLFVSRLERSTTLARRT